MERIKKLEVRRSAEQVLAGGFYTESALFLCRIVAAREVVTHPIIESTIAIGACGLGALFSILSEYTDEKIKSLKR